ncbi:MAG: sigma-70 family RNA polymerase sigma factor, partial [Candidatus Aminicenantes bacterium]
MSMKPDILGAVIKKTTALFQKQETITKEFFQYLLNPVKENLYNFIFKALNFCEDANDVYQETILRAFKYRKSYDKQGSFKTWLFTIAHNEIKGYFNKQKKLPGKVVPEEHAEIIDDPGSDNQTLVRDIYEVAQHLTPNQRRVFFLFYDQQFSIQEISEIT